MKKNKIDLMMIAGVILPVILYTASLNYRGLLTAGEYEFAMLLKMFFPTVSGTFLPKLPAAIATLLTAGVLWLTAARLKLQHPGNAAGFYLCFPPVWWVGTSASPAPVLALMVSIATAGLFFARREKNLYWRFGGFAAGLAGAVGAALISQSKFFSWAGVVLAFMPVTFLTFAIYLDKLAMRDRAGRRLNRMALMTVAILALLLAYCLMPSFCRMLEIEFPENFIAVNRRQLFRPALALLVPYLWLYMALKSESVSEKGFFICFAIGFVMLTLPPAIPWSKVSTIPAREELESLIPELMQNNPVFFADDSSCAAISYSLNIPVQRVGRSSGDLPPDQLADQVRQALEQGDVIVVSANGELDSFLPENLIPEKFTSKQNFKLFRFTGEQK